MRILRILGAAAVAAALCTAQPAKSVKRPADRPPAIVQQWMSRMTLRDKVAQLITMPCFGENPSTRSQDYKKFRHWVRDLHIGGLIVVNRVVAGTVRNADPYAMAVFLNKMQRMSRVPLLVSADFERGASMRVANTTKFPHNMAYGAARDYQGTSFEAAQTAREARALGVHWVFAPDADVNNNPENPIINIRSFGEDPGDVARHVVAYIEGAHSETSRRVLITAKHFPGHGDTAVDTHLGLARLEAGRERLNAIEWVPFREAVAKGVDAVMSAHIALPAVEPQEIPSTISRSVLTGVLREELGFRGIIVTDAMDMQALSKQFSPGEAGIRALEAGVDVLLMPRDADDVINAVADAIRSGRLTRKRIDESVLRVLTAKARTGLDRTRVVNLDAITDVIESPDAEARAQETADRAVTLVRNEGAVIPLRDPAKTCLFALVDNRSAPAGRQLLQEAAKRSPLMLTRILDASSQEFELKESLQAAANCQTVIAAAYVAAAAYRGNIGVAGPLGEFVNSLLGGKAPVVFLSFGNPYLLRAFPTVAAYMAMFSTVPVSETAAAKALFGEIPITGRMPVSIPGFAKLGDGIQLGISKTAEQTAHQRAPRAK